MKEAPSNQNDAAGEQNNEAREDDGEAGEDNGEAGEDDGEADEDDGEADEDDGDGGKPKDNRVDCIAAGRDHNDTAMTIRFHLVHRTVASLAREAGNGPRKEQR